MTIRIVLLYLFYVQRCFIFITIRKKIVYTTVVKYDIEDLKKLYICFQIMSEITSYKR